MTAVMLLLLSLAGRPQWWLLVIAIPVLAGFVWWEQRATNPMLPLRIVLDRNRGGSYLAFFLATSSVVSAGESRWRMFFP